MASLSATPRVPTPEDSRKSSICTEELTPIVLNQLHSATTRLNEDARKQRRGSRSRLCPQKFSHVHESEVLCPADSGSECSCGEGTRTAEAFMSGLQSALPQTFYHAHQPKSAQSVESSPGLSEELVSEVDSVLTKLMSSVNKEDPSLLPLIMTLQASLKASKDPAAGLFPKHTKQWHDDDGQDSSVPLLTNFTKAEPNVGLEPIGNHVKRDWAEPCPSTPTPTPTHGHRQRPQDTVSQEEEEEEVMLSKSVSLEEDEIRLVVSQIPWKIRGARKRARKHLTAGQTKGEFRQSFGDSTVKVSPSYSLKTSSLVRNMSDGAILSAQQNQSTLLFGSSLSAAKKRQSSKNPSRFYQPDNGLCFASEIGYVSDICDYGFNLRNASKSSKFAIKFAKTCNQPAPGIRICATNEVAQPEVGASKIGTNMQRKNIPGSHSAVRAKIARRKMMRRANVMDNPHGSLSDQEVNSEANDEDSIEEKQDKELINEKGTVHVGLMLTPETAAKTWSSRFSNIKSSFDTPSEEDKSRSPSINHQPAPAPSLVPALPFSEEVPESRGRSRTRHTEKICPDMLVGRSHSAHNIKLEDQKNIVEIYSRRAQSKEDKEKLNKITAHNSAGLTSENTSAKPTHKLPESGRDSADYHQYLEMIERYRGNNPKVYSRPLQKNVPLSKSKIKSARETQTAFSHNGIEHQAKNPLPLVDSPTRAEIMGFVKNKHANDSGTQKKNDMDYNEYMNIINKVRKTKEFTRVRTEQLRLASMYVQEKKRQEELKKEEERLRKEQEQMEQEVDIQHSQKPTYNREKGEVDNSQAEILIKSANEAEIETISSHESIDQDESPPTEWKSVNNDNQPELFLQQCGSQEPEHIRLEQIRLEQLEQKQQQNLRECQVKAEQERLAKLREEQIKQEKEREEINRLEHERLQQIQEEQRRLEYERRIQKENMRQEHMRLEEERKKQERLQWEKNAQYNKQRLDIEAKKFASDEDQHIRQRLAGESDDLNVDNMTPEELLFRERLFQQDQLREEHKREEAQIRQEKLNLIRQEETLISRQEEMLSQIENERANLVKQEDLIRSRQQSRLQHVRQEKKLLEKQEEMLFMREQQLMQERQRQDKLRDEQRVLREQEEAIRKRQEEISKELMMGELSDTGSESITMCTPREGQIFVGKLPIFPDQSLYLGKKVTPILQQPLSHSEDAMPSDFSSDTDHTLDDEDGNADDYYETKIEVKQNHTSVPTTVRTIETKIDNSPWAPITPYLTYSDKPNQEELSSILSKGTGIITSPESVRTSTNLITTPESSLQSRKSLSPSYPGVPPLPMDKSAVGSLEFCQADFVPVQPEVPPRDDSFATTASYTTGSSDSSHIRQHMNIVTDCHNHRSLIEDLPSESLSEIHHSTKIGGPGSAFKPYASNENLFDPTLFYDNEALIIQGSNSLHNISSSWIQNQKDYRLPLYNKVKELRKTEKAPFSTTDTEPEMKECNLHTDLRKKNKAKTCVYSTSETEEEYQLYLKSRPKWHGKGGHKDSWDPLLIESPPQITQKPVGFLQKPLPMAPLVVERGTQIGATPAYISSQTLKRTRNKPEERNDRKETKDAIMHAAIEASLVLPGNLLKSSSAHNVSFSDAAKRCIVVEGQNDQLANDTEQKVSSNAPNERASNINRSVSIDIVGGMQTSSNSNTTEPKTAPILSKLANSGQIKQFQEKYFENISKENIVIPKKQLQIKQQKESPQMFMDEAVSKVEMKTDVIGNTFKNTLPIQRVNPTIAAMEILTRKELKLNEMEKKLSNKSLVRAPFKLGPSVNLQTNRNSYLSVDDNGPSFNNDKSSKECTATSNFQELPGDCKSDLQPSKIIIDASAPQKEDIGHGQILKSVQMPIGHSETVECTKKTGNEEAMSNDVNNVSRESVRKAAERFEKVVEVQCKENAFPASRLNVRVRSKSIGSNLSQKMTELEEEQERARGPGKSSTVHLPWTGESVKKSPSIQKYATRKVGYGLCTSKSSDSITATKRFLKARLQQQEQGLYNTNAMSKSIEKQMDIYTRTREDIRKILQLAKTSSVSERIRLFDGQKLHESFEDANAIRIQKANAIRREIEEAKAQKPIFELSEGDMVDILKPAEMKIKPSKVSRNGKAKRSSSSASPSNTITSTYRSSALGVAGAPLRINQPGDRVLEAAPGAILRINQLADAGHKSEIRSILRKNRMSETEALPGLRETHGYSSASGQAPLQSKIDACLQVAHESSPVTTDSRHVEMGSLSTGKTRANMLVRRKSPKLVHKNLSQNGEILQIYAQSATDYSATEEDEEERQATPKNEELLQVPLCAKATVASNLAGLRKSKSFAGGQFECVMDEEEITKKQETISAFFGPSSAPVTTKETVVATQRPFNQQRRNSNASISDMILGDEEDLMDVDAMFERLLSNTYDTRESNEVEEVVQGKGGDATAGNKTSAYINTVTGQAQTQEQQRPRRRRNSSGTCGRIVGNGANWEESRRSGSGSALRTSKCNEQLAATATRISNE